MRPFIRRIMCCPLIVRHFQKRLSCEEWAIHDVGRHVAAYYDGKQVTIVRVESLKTDIAYSQDEEGFQQLWRDYYRHMAIRERNNPTAQSVRSCQKSIGLI